MDATNNSGTKVFNKGIAFAIVASFLAVIFYFFKVNKKGGVDRAKILEAAREAKAAKAALKNQDLNENLKEDEK